VTSKRDQGSNCYLMRKSKDIQKMLMGAVIQLETIIRVCNSV